MGNLIAFIIVICIVGAIISAIFPYIGYVLIIIGIIAIILIVANYIKKKKLPPTSRRTPTVSNNIPPINQSTEIVEKNGTKYIHTRIIISEDNAPSPYFSAIEKASLSKNDDDRILYLEKALSALPEFISHCKEFNDELPPGVPPRDTLPELYMRYGEWIKAQRTVNECFSMGALTKEEYIDIIEMIEARQTAVEGLLDFLRKNPGYLQKNVYKSPALSAYDHNALVWVCRSFKLIRKEKYGNTNKLYCN